MRIDTETCYRALAARDARFDGLFFVGVTTTGIYCRPICSARTPSRDRCRFLASAAAAEHAGFRPCLRCRPELAPGHAPVDALGRTARLAAARIEAGALNDDGSLETLARELGLSSRQLRRTIRREFGVSPVELAQTRRLLLAKQLLTETNLPVIEVALASGFASIRRFNALFRSHYSIDPMRRSISGTILIPSRSLPSMDKTVFYRQFSSPLGKLLLTCDGQSLTGLFMTRLADGSAPEVTSHWKQDDAPFRAACTQLTAYFEGETESFDLDMTLAGTPFQKRVWQELCNIPYGCAISYAELARRIGQPGSSRAVGGANGRNPISIIVPCHRVIGADGGLGGYGGGLDRKRWLLEHEAEVLERHPQWRSAPFPGSITPNLLAV